MFLAIVLVRIIPTIVIVIALPSGRNALVVSALELGFRTCPVLTLTNVFLLVGVVAAVVFEVALPFGWDATTVFTSED